MNTAAQERTEAPLVSVIVPVYNTAPWLRKCLDSIINQTYRNLEIICVNDGSPDNAAEILDEYAAKDARIKVIHQENAGVSAARNRGLDIAAGEYVSFVDSDDWLEPETYERIIAAFVDDVDIVAMGVVIDGDVKDKEGLEEYFNRLPQGRSEVTPFAFAELNMSLPTKVYRREVIGQKSISFPEGIAYGEDSAFVCCVLAHSRALYNVGNRFYHYVQHESSAMQGPQRMQRCGKDLLRAWDYVREHYARWGALEEFWPICERWFTDICLFLEESAQDSELKECTWKLAVKCGLLTRSHHPAMNKMRMYYMSRWEKLFHWYKANCECFGIAGYSVYSITYTRYEFVYRLLGRIIHKKGRYV